MAPPSLSILCYLSVSLLLILPASAVPALNSTADADVGICAYPISGQYGFLPRLLTYLSLIFALIARQLEWLIIGALASAMLATSTAVVHVMVILGQDKDPAVLDCDVIAIIALLLSSFSIYLLVISFSSTARKPAAKPVLLVWGSWLWVGLLVAVIATQPLFGFGRKIPKSYEIICRSVEQGDETIMQTVNQLQEQLNFNCTYDCFAYSSRIRNQDEILVFRKPSTNQLPEILWFMAIAGLLLGGLVHIIMILDPAGSFSESIESASRFRSAIIPPRRAVMSRYKGYMAAGILGMAFIPAIVLSEIYLHDLPHGESLYAIGQWAPWVSATLAILSAVFFNA